MNSSAGTKLYERKQAYIPRIAAVHDLCGYGKCSLGIAIPVLSAGGCDVCPVPTSLFSAHTRYPVFTMHDTTSILSDYLDAWEKEGVDIDAIYSGFLGSAEQVAIIQRLYLTYGHALRIVDPVMGDGGKAYPTYTPELCEAMGGLVKGADVLTPNLTEAAIMTGIPYVGQDIEEATVKLLIEALLAKGAKHVILKGVEPGDGTVRNYIAGDDGTFEYIEHDLLPQRLHGTGDLYCSTLTAGIMAGYGLRDAAYFAGEFVRSAIIVTKEQPDYEMRGVSFELILGKVAALLQ
jgi:pyridoxine kinase